MDKPKQPPYISIETQKRMHAFFMKTSAPRLVRMEEEAAEKKAEEQMKERFNKKK